MLLSSIGRVAPDVDKWSGMDPNGPESWGKSGEEFCYRSLGNGRLRVWPRCWNPSRSTQRRRRAFRLQAAASIARQKRGSPTNTSCRSHSVENLCSNNQAAKSAERKRL